jgi:hypothetical protein
MLREYPTFFRVIDLWASEFSGKTIEFGSQ